MFTIEELLLYDDKQLQLLAKYLGLEGEERHDLVLKIYNKTFVEPPVQPEVQRSVRINRIYASREN